MYKLFATVAAVLAVIGLGGFWFLTRSNVPAPLDQDSYDALYSNPPGPPAAGLRTFHLGHSLVGPIMPVMLTQLADNGHSYASQVGWGTRLKAHWEPDVKIKGFTTHNFPPEFEDAHAAIASGTFDAVVLTEGVEIKHAIEYGNSPEYLYRWADKIWAANPDTRVYFYETWHVLDDPEGWLERLDRDLEKYWEGEILRRALAYEGMERPIYVIPAGQVMARFVRAVEAQGGIGPIKTREDLFKKKDDGTQDNIHFNDFGAYLVALTHYAVLYQTSPVGLPHQLTKANGNLAEDPGPEAARLMQEIVWDVVSNYPRSGVSS